MTKYLLRFTPMAPFFFGNERGLYFPGSKSQYQNLYFVRSENSPSQTTVLGALRFLLLQANGRSANCRDALSKEEGELVGKGSFSFEEKSVQNFGAIGSISPVFLMKGEDCYIPAPMDHNAADVTAGGKYSPLRQYEEASSLDGGILYAKDYDSKCGVVSGYVSLKDGEVLENDELFSPVVRVGVNRRQQGKDDGGFFKREYKRLKDGFCFAVSCELDESKMGNNIPKIPKIAYLGQGHTPFRVDIDKNPSSPDGLKIQVSEFLKTKHSFADGQEKAEEYVMIYCLGDAFMTSEDKEKDLYQEALFGVTKSRDFRSLSTELKDGRLHLNKSGSLYHLMKAGSVLIFKNDADADVWTNRFKHENASKIGFNAWIKFKPWITTGKEETK